MKILNVSRQTVIARDVKLANNFFSRFKGLLAVKNFPAQSALVLKPCDSIHTFFMRFPIDVFFANKENKIIKIYRELKPWRLSGVFFKSRLCVELPDGSLDASRTQEGDRIEIIG